MHPITVSIITITILLSITFVILFGDLPNYRGSLVHRLRTRLMNGYTILVRQVQKFDDKHCGGILYKVFVEKLYRYYKLIPPVFYIAMIAGLLVQFFKFCYPRIANPNIHLIIVILFINLSSFLMAMFIDPGDLMKIDARHSKAFPYDELIFFDHSLYGNVSRNYCKTCKLIKIPRSKHCSVCGKCVLLLDHHCLWLDNCVGYYNYKWFLSFLFSLIWILIYGGILTYSVLSSEIGLVQQTGNVFQTWYNLISNTTLPNERCGIIFLICLALPWLILWFTFEHLQFIYLGMTTNESSKWDFVRYLVDEGALYRFKSNDEEVYLIKDLDGLFYRLSDENWKFNIDTSSGEVIKISDMRNELTNVYDHGVWGNLKQRIIG